jgi:transcriptional regulator with XRE-family HTH domain
MTNLSLLRAFGLVIRTRRRALDMTQQALASISDVDRSFIARIEAGKHQQAIQPSGSEATGNVASDAALVS